ncbi:hypothetical protein LINGRAHAP2_LOCUS15868 [Linum grandiflorum]
MFTILFFLAFCGVNTSDDSDDSSATAPAPQPVTISGVVCNKTNYTNVYPTNSYVKHVLEELSEEVSQNKGYAKLIKFPEIDRPIMSGQGTCTTKKNMSRAECAQCIKDGAKKVLDSCPQRIGAQFTAAGCKLRYDVFHA